jgi:DNA-binding LacI/PurR family transcriptional regulator
MAAGIKDIARELNLGPSTVAHALAGNGTISVRTRQRVLDHAKRIGYLPNRNPQRMRSSHTGVIGMIVPDLVVPASVNRVVDAPRRAVARARATDVQRQLDETRRQQERLLNRHLSGNIDEATFGMKNTELRDRVSTLIVQLEATDRRKDERADLALKVFELSQSLRDKWVGADYPEKR